MVDVFPGLKFYVFLCLSILRVKNFYRINWLVWWCLIYYSKSFDKMNMKAADNAAATGTVTSQAYTIDLKSFQSTAFSLTPLVSVLAFEYPTNTTDPTLQCVVEIGNPILLANRTVIAAPISIVKPLKWKQNVANILCDKRNFKSSTYVDGVIFVRSVPTVSITRLPQSQRPTDMPTPPNNRIGSGVSDCWCTDLSL